MEATQGGAKCAEREAEYFIKNYNKLISAEMRCLSSSQLAFYLRKKDERTIK